MPGDPGRISFTTDADPHATAEDAGAPFTSAKWQLISVKVGDGQGGGCSDAACPAGREAGTRPFKKTRIERRSPSSRSLRIVVSLSSWGIPQ